LFTANWLYPNRLLSFLIVCVRYRRPNAVDIGSAEFVSLCLCRIGGHLSSRPERQALVRIWYILIASVRYRPVTPCLMGGDAIIRLIFFSNNPRLRFLAPSNGTG
jgi:hypothetical protein